MSSVMGALLLRRDANRARRAGTGRQTTKRAFTIALPKAGHFTSGAAAAATPGQLKKRKSQEAALVDLAGAPAADENDGIAADPPMPNSEAAFRRASKLMRTPVGGVPPPPEEDEEVESGGGVAPMPIQWEMPSAGAASADPSQEFDSTQTEAQAQQEAEAEALRRSMGTSPINFGAVETGIGAAKASMGTSPLAQHDDDDGGAPADFDEPYDDWNNDDDNGGPLPMATVDEPPPPPATKKPPRKAANPNGRKRKTSLDRLGRNPGASSTAADDDRRISMHTEGQPRQSGRQRFRPLEYWRGERVVYGRRDSAKFEAIVDVVVAQREPTPPHFRRQRLKAEQRAGSKLAVSGTELVVHDDPLADAVDHTPGLDEAAGGKRKKKLASKAGGGYMTAGLQSGPGLLKSGA